MGGIPATRMTRAGRGESIRIVDGLPLECGRKVAENVYYYCKKKEDGRASAFRLIVMLPIFFPLFFPSFSPNVFWTKAVLFYNVQDNTNQDVMNQIEYYFKAMHTTRT